MPIQPDRLYQLGFDEHLRPVRREVTPDNLTRLRFPIRESNLPDRMSRFVREARENIMIDSPADAARYLQKHIFTPFEACDQEELWGLLLNFKHIVVAELLIYRGTVNSAHIRLPELFKEAVRLNAPAIILSHNHPSGVATPSPEDIDITRKAMEVGDYLSINLVDHLVIGKDCWASIQEILKKG